VRAAGTLRRSEAGPKRPGAPRQERESESTDRGTAVDTFPFVAGHEVHLSRRFFKAAEWAAARHAARARGARTTPSLGQVLGLASLVIEDGGTEREAIAAMVVDAIGDREPPIEELHDRFGKKISELVERCASDRPEAGIELLDLDVSTWKERREAYVARLEATDDDRVIRVHAAQTLRELRALVNDLRRHGSIAFARFVTPPGDQLAYYQSLLEAYTRRMPRNLLAQEVRTSLSEVDRLVEMETATAAWRVAHVDAA
jgi:(p)ppGpp synthase/HD superfamily hydrolase